MAFRVNGEAVTVHVPAERTLVDVLRDDLGLTGTKKACATGVCGACSVLVDGALRSACTTLAVTLGDCEVRTIEGLATGESLAPLQRAFVEHGALQCGFCTPGQLMAATALLDETPQPSLDDIRAWMAGNLCRCTGYYPIARAIQAAASTAPGGAAPGA